MSRPALAVQKTTLNKNPVISDTASYRGNGLAAIAGTLAA
jgi:hypothetical protein